MRKRWIFAICAIALMAPVSVVKAQYPQEPKEVKEAVKKRMDEEYKLSDEAWEKAYDTVDLGDLEVRDCEYSDDEITLLEE